MTQLRFLSPRLSYDRRDLQTIFLCALVGSLTGALYTRGYSGYVFVWESIKAAQPFLLSVLRLSLFPLLLAAALFLQRRPLFCLLFFGKGFAGSCVLCVAAASGAGLIHSLLLRLLLETLFPLPAFFLLGAVWYGQTRAERWSLWSILPAALSVMTGLLLERLLF